MFHFDCITDKDCYTTYFLINGHLILHFLICIIELGIVIILYIGGLQKNYLLNINQKLSLLTATHSTSTIIFFTIVLSKEAISWESSYSWVALR